MPNSSQASGMVCRPAKVSRMTFKRILACSEPSKRSTSCAPSGLRPRRVMVFSSVNYPPTVSIHAGVVGGDGLLTALCCSTSGGGTPDESPSSSGAEAARSAATAFSARTSGPPLACPLARGLAAGLRCGLRRRRWRQPDRPLSRSHQGLLPGTILLQPDDLLFQGQQSAP